MTNASRFVFGRDFREPAGPTPQQLAALAEAEARGRQAGIAEGRAQAEAETARRLADATRRLADAATRLLAEADDHRATMEDEAIRFALDLGRKLAGEALAALPLGPVAEAARAAFQHLRGVPHLAVRVNDALVEDVDALIKRIARERGYEGRLVVLGDPDIARGDVRLEWADGGLVREAARIDDEITRAAGAA